MDDTSLLFSPARSPRRPPASRRCGSTGRLGEPMSSPPPFAQDRNWALVAGHAILVVHAISRHKALFVLTWAAVVGMSLAAVAALPKAYDVETTIQVSPTELISGAAQRPGRSSSTSGTYAYETVLSRQALIDLIRQTDLMEKWPKTRGPVLTLKDAIWGRIYRQPTAAEKLDIFVAILETRLWVKTEDTTITIGIRFPDPDLALRLVESAQTEFLEARQVQEIKTVEDAIQILEKTTSESRAALDESLTKLDEARQKHSTKTGRRGSPPVASARGLDLPPSRRGSQLEVEVETKERDLASLVEARQRRIAELEGRLEELRSVYSETHPSVVATRESLEALRQESPEIAALQRELAPLETELQQRGLLSEVPLKGLRERPSAIAAADVDRFDPLEDQDPEINYAKAELHHAYVNYNGLRDRLQAARIELDSSRAAFKYRYVVIKPAQPPRGPASPKSLLVLIASLSAGLVLAAFAPTYVDLASRTFLEDWQVEQSLGVRLLGTLPDL